MRVLFLSVFLAVLALLGIYFYFYFRRMISCCAKQIRGRSLTALAALGGVLAVALAFNILSVWAIAIVYLFGFSLCMELFHLIVKRIRPGCKRWDVIYRCGLVPMLLSALMMGYGFWNMNQVVRTDYRIETEKAAGEKGYRIVMISDLHYGTIKGLDHLKACVERIEEEEPDLVVLCGDLVDEGTTRERMEEAMAVLGSIRCPMGVYFVYGNHDRTRYAGNPHFTAEELEQTVIAAGIHVLADEAAQPEGGFTVIGRDDRSFPQNGQRKSLEELTKDVDRTDFILLLDHQPCELEAADAAGCDMMLSGHTHAGQIWPAGQLSQAAGIVELNYGYRKLNRLQVIVSSGLVGWGYPMRTSRHCEYVVIDVENGAG